MSNSLNVVLANQRLGICPKLKLRRRNKILLAHLLKTPNAEFVALKSLPEKSKGQISSAINFVNKKIEDQSILG